jgi:hypothetical protein
MPCSKSPLVTATSSCHIPLIFSTLQSFPPLYVCLIGDHVISGFQIENLYTCLTLLSCLLSVPSNPSSSQYTFGADHGGCVIKDAYRLRQLEYALRFRISFRTLPYAAFLRYVALCRKVVALRWADPTSPNAYQMLKRLIVTAVN